MDRGESERLLDLFEALENAERLKKYYDADGKDEAADAVYEDFVDWQRLYESLVAGLKMVRRTAAKCMMEEVRKTGNANQYLYLVIGELKSLLHETEKGYQEELEAVRGE